MNSVLMTGEIPGLFAKDEMMAMTADLRNSFLKVTDIMPHSCMHDCIHISRYLCVLQPLVFLHCFAHPVHIVYTLHEGFDFLFQYGWFCGFVFGITLTYIW